MPKTIQRPEAFPAEIMDASVSDHGSLRGHHVHYAPQYGHDAMHLSD